MLLSNIGQLLLFSFRSILVILLLTAVLVFITICKEKERADGLPKKITIVYSIASKAVLANITCATVFLAVGSLETKSHPNAFWKLPHNAVIAGNANPPTMAPTGSL